MTISTNAAAIIFIDLVGIESAHSFWDANADGTSFYFFQCLRYDLKLDVHDCYALDSFQNIGR